MTSNNIKYVVTDVDGVLTDGSMYYTDSGQEMKRFSTYDGYAVTMCHEQGIKVIMITGEETEIVNNRANKIGVDYLFSGVSNKLNVLSEFLANHNCGFENIAYIGDDLNDLECMKKSCIAGCPENARKEIKAISSIVLRTRGGDGAFRDFIEEIL